MDQIILLFRLVLVSLEFMMYSGLAACSILAKDREKTKWKYFLYTLSIFTIILWGYTVYNTIQLVETTYPWMWI